MKHIYTTSSSSTQNRLSHTDLEEPPVVLVMDGVQSAEVAAGVLARVTDTGPKGGRGQLRSGGRGHRPPQAQLNQTHQPTRWQHGAATDTAGTGGATELDWH